MDLSLILPVYNEEESVRPVLEEARAELLKTGRSFEIIFINDGSRDDGERMIRGMMREFPEIRLLTFDRNHGQTAAFDAGIKASRGDIVVTMDCDGQNDPSDIPKLLEQLPKFDVAVGWRVNRNDTFIRKISSRIANSVRNRWTRETIHDTGCSLKAFKREAILSVHLFEGMHRFFPTLCKLEGYTVTEVPVNHRHRARGKSKYNIFNRLFKSMKDLYAVRWMQNRKIRYKATEIARD